LSPAQIPSSTEEYSDTAIDPSRAFSSYDAGLTEPRIRAGSS
jgi:hypothetical protein